MVRTVKKVSAPTKFAAPIGRAGSTFGDGALAASGVSDRGPLSPASAPNTPDGTQPNMAY